MPDWKDQMNRSDETGRLEEAHPQPGFTAPREAPEPVAPASPHAVSSPASPVTRGKRGKQNGAAEPKGAKGFHGKRVVGLKIGASQLAAATVANKGDAQLVQVAREQLDPGIVVGGEVRDPQRLAEALKVFFKKHKLPKRNVRLGIANNRIGVRTFEVPAVGDAKQLGNAIRFRAQEVLPVPLEQALLDYRVLDEGGDGASGQRILLVVTYRELVDRYVKACREAGIQLAAIDLEAFALLRALAPPRDVGQRPHAAFVAVSVGHDRSIVAVSDGRVCEFTRVLDWGGARLNTEIAQALGVAPSEADGIKRAVSLVASDEANGLPQEVAARATEAVRRQVQSFAREVLSSLQFYQSQPGSHDIAEIVITGGTAHLRGFAELLQQMLDVTVRIGNPLARTKVGKKVKGDDPVGSLAVAIGLGIED